jgi:hypothetical protein
VQLQQRPLRDLRHCHHDRHVRRVQRAQVARDKGAAVAARVQADLQRQQPVRVVHRAEQPPHLRAQGPQL